MLHHNRCEQRESELKLKLKENDLKWRQKAELKRHLKATLRELAASKRQVNRWSESTWSLN